MNRSSLRQVFTISLLALAACSGSGTSGGQRNATNSPASNASTSTPEASGEHHSAPVAGDVRVMMYQPKGDVLVIMVNEGHSWRKTADGRHALALGDDSRAYVVLPDAEMGALLESLDSRGYSAIATPFAAGDEQFISTSARDIPRFQGIVFIERGSTKTKVLGYRPSGPTDANGQKSLQQYTDLKAVAQIFAMRNQRSEYPSGGIVFPEKTGR